MSPYVFARSGQAATFDIRHPTFDIRRSTFDVRHPTFDVRHPTFDVRHPTFDVRRSTFDIRRSTFDVRRSTFDVRRSTFEIYPPRCSRVSQISKVSSRFVTFAEGFPLFRISSATLNVRSFFVQGSLCTAGAFRLHLALRCTMHTALCTFGFNCESSSRSVP